ncbi:NAD(P)-binding protein [Zopfia rhizophila CBS 207.26]|uniref:NAD(P)-binding protein n=1 Tax=Zopfia rhizophila CBS 207.26 TaxID=1314779 RepID=A0A6A6EIW4_9PEZI|nr:NAD(P)-binding protein [Zopfia rhizophila CBS 207.26]
MVAHIITAKAIVTTPPKDGKFSWSMKNVKLREPHDDELTVRIVASGICHTDIALSSGPAEIGLWPRILGHEGAGVVEKVGSRVTHVKPDDFVLLSFDFCSDSSCHNCSTGYPSYCPSFIILNIAQQPDIYDIGGEAGAGVFFGQSSFSSTALVKGNSAVNVSELITSEEELKLFAPFGCGFQTGAGSITELADANEKDSVAVFGLGGVGLLALMAAKLRGCVTIIGVDRVQSRLDIAKSVGATHVIDTSGFKDLNGDLTKAIKEATNGAGTSINVDTTGVLDIVHAGVNSLRPRGQLVLIGIMQGLTLPIDLSDLLANGKSIRGCIEGSALPKKYIPQMIQWYRDGKLPIDTLIKHYPADDFEKALEDMHTGATVKPILIW